jgi:hypothetical protein
VSGHSIDDSSFSSFSSPEALIDSLRHCNGVGAAFVLQPLTEVSSPQLQRKNSSKSTVKRDVVLRLAHKTTTAHFTENITDKQQTNVPSEKNSQHEKSQHVGTQLDNFIVLNPDWFFRLLAALRLVYESSQRTAVLTAKQISLAWKQVHIITLTLTLTLTLTH